MDRHYVAEKNKIEHLVDRKGQDRRNENLRDSTFQQMGIGIKYFHRNEANYAIYFITTIAYLLLLFSQFERQ